MWFIVPAFGRVELARICLRQLRRTCDQLAAEGIDATAVVISDDENRETALDLGFGTVTRGNEFVSAKFNDGIQAALDPYLTDPPLEAGRYEVLRPTGYRGHARGSVFQARLTAEAERRAVIRGDINVLSCEPLTFCRGDVHGARRAGTDGRPTTSSRAAPTTGSTTASSRCSPGRARS
jgi:hypothetical protein